MPRFFNDHSSLVNCTQVFWNFHFFYRDIQTNLL